MIAFKKKRNQLLVEISAQWLKWAVLEPARAHGKKAIIDIGVLPLAGPSEELREKLITIVNKHKIQAGDVVGSLPRFQATVRHLELPSTDPAEIQDMFELQAAKQTPYDADQIISGYYFISASQEGYSDIMLVIADRQVVVEYLRILQEAGLKTRRISLGILDSASWVAKEIGLEVRKNDERAALVVDVDYDTTDFFVYAKGSVLYTQNISIGFDKLTHDPEGSLREKFLVELTRSLEIYFRQRSAKEAAFFVVTGATEALTPFREELKKIFGMEPIEVRLPGAIEKILGENKISFTSLLGLAAREKPFPLNLVPQEVMLQSALVERSREIFFMGILALSLVLAGIGFFACRYLEKQRYFDWLNTKLLSTAGESEKVESKRALIREIRDLNSKSKRFFMELIHLHNVLPNGIVLTEFNLTQDRHLELRGRAGEEPSVSEFAKSLKKDASFQKVETRQVVTRRVENKEVTDFEIDCQLAEA